MSIENHAVELEKESFAIVIKKEQDGDSFSFEIVAPTRADDYELKPYDMAVFALAHKMTDGDFVQKAIDDFAAYLESHNAEE